MQLLYDSPLFQTNVYTAFALSCRPGYTQLVYYNIFIATLCGNLILNIVKEMLARHGLNHNLVFVCLTLIGALSKDGLPVF